MKWLSRISGSEVLTSLVSAARGVEAESKKSATAGAGGVPSESVEHETEHTEKWAVPSAVEEERGADPAATETIARAPSSRRQSRTVASPIPAMLAESMGLAEEPPAAATPAAEHFNKIASSRR